MSLRYALALSSLVLSVLHSPAATAQGRLSVPDAAVVLPDDLTFTLANPTGAPVLLDSLVMRFAGDEREFESWGIQTQAGDEPTFGCAFYRGSTFPGTPRCEPAATFSAGAVVRVEAFYSICSICRPGEAATTSGFRGGTADTLLVYSGGSVEPERVVFDASGFVALGDMPEAGVLSVSVSPNPASGRGTVLVSVSQPATRVAATVYDVLGRQVAVLHDGPLAAGTHPLAFDASALAPGLYVVRVAVTPEGGTRWTETRRVTVTR